MELIVTPDGGIRCAYAEAVDLTALGSVAIRRASHVEPDDRGHWVADLSPVGGPRLGPFTCRSQALHAETEWLSANWLTQVSGRH